ncbi:MAG TPA: hypothetical protein VFI42_14165 [Thermomicrobiaceae bacterium]|nr:hypothetical protein [Thermomicrobiaceae bacterium]
MNDRRKPNPQQVARAGEHLVAAEIHRRGAYAVTFAGNMPKIDVIASDKVQNRSVTIQVKTKSGSSPGWQTQTTRGQQRSPDPEESRFWILVDLDEIGSTPSYYIIPEWWMQNDIYEAHQAYLNQHGGSRPVTQASKHHKIERRRVEQWRDRWDLLGVFADETNAPD